MSGGIKIQDKNLTANSNIAAVTNSNLHVQITSTAGDGVDVTGNGLNVNIQNTAGEFADVSSNGLHTVVQNTSGDTVNVTGNGLNTNIQNTAGEFADVSNNGLHVSLQSTAGNYADITSTGSQYVTLQKQDGLLVDVDDVTSALPVLEYEHHKIHCGNHYFIDTFIDVANASNYEFVLTTPNTLKWIHLIWEYYWESEGEFEFYEGITTDADGTVITSFNNNRNSANTAGLVITHTPTNATGGTLQIHQRIGSGRGIGGTRRADQEKVLKQNTKYLIRATNRALGASNLFNIQLDWYEHTSNA
jgi:hypothetical protein